MDKTTAILARTNRALRPFEEALAEANIRYHVVGKSGYFSQPEIRALVDYLNLVLFPSDWALAGAIRAPFAVSKYLPKTKLLARLKELRTDEFSYWHFLSKEPHQLVDTKNLPGLREFVQFVSSLSRYRGLLAFEAVKQVLQATRAIEAVSGDDDQDNDAAG